MFKNKDEVRVCEIDKGEKRGKEKSTVCGAYCVRAKLPMFSEAATNA